MSEGLVDCVNENGFVQNSNDPNQSVFDPQLYHSASSDENVEVIGNGEKINENDF